MVAKTPGEREQIARLAAFEKWAKTPDRAGATAAARRAFADRFERQVDPEQKLPPAVRAQLADAARKAFYTRLALKSAQARRRKSAAA